MTIDYPKVRVQLGDINACPQENISGIRVVQASAREGHEEDLCYKASFGYFNAYYKGVWRRATLS